MAKRLTSETIAANLAPWERGALFDIAEGRPPDRPGNAGVVTELIQKRLIGSNKGRLSFTNRGRAVFEVIRASLPPGVDLVMHPTPKMTLVEMKSASNASDAGHQSLVPNLPQSNSPHAPPELPPGSQANLGAAYGGPAGYGSGHYGVGPFDKATFDATAFDGVPASPPYADAFEQAAREALVNPDPAVEGGIAESAFKDETPPNDREAFFDLLRWHFRRGTRPDGDFSIEGRTWGIPEFAQVIGVETATVRGWLRSRSLPLELAWIEGAFFGNNSSYGDFRKNLRDAYYRAKAGRAAKASSPPPAEAIPSAEKRALQFSGTFGPIDLAPSEPGEHLQDGVGRREDYAELRSKAVELSALGSNRLGRVGLPILRFLQLAEDLGQVRLKIFWSRINTLRILWQDHEAASKAKELEPNEHRLEPIVASQLKDLVETINVFVVDDQGIMELDAVRPGPRDADAAKQEIAILKPAIDDATANAQIATEAARESLKEQVENVEAAGDNLAIRQANDFGRRSVRNFVGELLRRAYAPVRATLQAAKSETGAAWKGVREGAYRAAGAAFITGAASDMAGITNFHGAFVNFVTHYADVLSAYVMQAFNNPMLVEIIKWIVRFSSPLPAESEPMRPPIPTESGHPVDGVKRGTLSAV
jgi:hypothetical protein